MKKIVTVILALSLLVCIAAMPEMPVMAADSSIEEGGITYSIPSGFKEYTEEDFAKSTNGLLGSIADSIDFGTWGNIAADLAAAGISMGISEYEYSDDLERVLVNTSASQTFKIFCLGKCERNLDTFAYYVLRENYLPQWVHYLTDEGYSADIYDAYLLYTDKGIPYVRLDGTSDSNGCCQLAVFQYNGYFDVVVFINSKTSDINSSTEIFNEFINSVSIANSSGNHEGDGTKYSMILTDRIELED